MTNFVCMNEYISPRGAYGSRGAYVADVSARKLAFLRRVYAYFTGSLLAAVAGALVALYAGADLSRLVVTVGQQRVVVPPLVAFFTNHMWLGIGLFFGSFFVASWARERPGVNVLALLGLGFVSGLYIAPMLWIATVMASQGATLSAAPVRDAFVLAGLGFTGLTSYALLSRRDFSFMRGFLTMGLWVVIGASLLSLFVGGPSLSLAIASVSVLLFGGFILYDTSRMAQDPDNRDAAGAALQLYLNFLNLFLALLRILGSSRRES